MVEDAKLTMSYTSATLNRPDEIRVLEFENNASDEFLRYRLISMSLDRNTRPFLALSYAWGATYADGSHLTDIIICNGYSLRVTSTLHAALRRIKVLFKSETLAGVAGSLYLWIDAICINQQDSNERAQQVGLMSRIYSDASHILVWLGEYTSDLHASVSHDDLCVCVHCTTGVDEAEKSRLRADVFQDLAARPWFGRRWIIQEYTLGQDVFFLIGPKILRVWEVHQGISSAGEQVPPVIARNSQPENLPTLLENLNFHSGALCSEPLDAVYALLGISRDRENFKVDYTRDFESVFVGVMATYQLKDIWPTILQCALRETTARRKEQASLPWWVPDWRHPRSLSMTGQTKLLLTAFSFAPNLQACIRGHNLILQGWLYDPIAQCEIYEPCPSSSTYYNRYSLEQRLDQLRERLAVAGATYVLLLNVRASSRESSPPCYLALYLRPGQKEVPREARSRWDILKCLPQSG